MLYEPRLLSASIGFIEFKSSISDHADQRRTSSRVNVVASVDVASQSRRRFQISRTSEENNLESYCCAAYQGHKKQIYHSSQRCTRLKTRQKSWEVGGSTILHFIYNIFKNLQWESMSYLLSPLDQCAQR